MPEVTVIPIDGIDTTSTPPCQLRLQSTRRQCGNPSAYRITSTCHCGETHILFICRECRNDINQGQGTCTNCGAGRGITRYI